MARKSPVEVVGKVLDDIMSDEKTRAGGNVFHIRWSGKDGAKHERRRVWVCDPTDRNRAVLCLANETDVAWGNVNWAIATLTDGQWNVLSRGYGAPSSPWLKQDFSWNDKDKDESFKNKPHIKLTTDNIVDFSKKKVEKELALELKKLEDEKELAVPISHFKRDLVAASKYPRYVR